MQEFVKIQLNNHGKTTLKGIHYVTRHFSIDIPKHCMYPVSTPLPYQPTIAIPLPVFYLNTLIVILEKGAENKEKTIGSVTGTLLVAA